MARMHYNYAAMDSKSATDQFKNSVLNEPVLWKCLLLIALTYLIWSEKLSIVLDLNPTHSNHSTGLISGQRVQASFLPNIPQPASPEKANKSGPRSQVMLPASSKGYVTYAIDPGFADRNNKSGSQVSAAMTKCQGYIDRFSPVAVAEMHKYGIPASITLAQGLLESNTGESNLAKNTNNHFGIKCFSKKCKKGHCANFSDDSHKDFFVKYSNIWSSYRAHSKLLKNSRRYESLFRLGSSDYRNWAKGLAKAGYATDKKYAEKLIALIENLQLYTLDQ